MIARVPHRTRAHPRVWWSRVKLRWPLLVWLGAAALAVGLYGETGRSPPWVGIVETVREEPAPAETARLTGVHVARGQPVRAGDLLAEFDTSVVDAGMQEIRAEVALEQVQLERQFSLLEVDADRRLKDLRLRQAADQHRLEALRGQVEALRGVVGVDAGGVRELAALRAEQEALSRTLALYPDAVAQAGQDLEEARRQRDEARRWTGGDDPRRFGAARDLLATLQERRRMFTLRARSDGVVSEVLHAPGDVVAAGDPVLRIVAGRPRRVIALIPEARAETVPPGAPAWVAHRSPGSPLCRATVEVLGPDIDSFLEFTSPVTGRSPRGRRVVLLLDAGHDFLPGETVTVHRHKPAWVEKCEAWRRAWKARRAGDDG